MLRALFDAKSRSFSAARTANYTKRNFVQEQTRPNVLQHVRAVAFNGGVSLLFSNYGKQTGKLHHLALGDLSWTAFHELARTGMKVIRAGRRSNSAVAVKERDTITIIPGTTKYRRSSDAENSRNLTLNTRTTIFILD